MKRNISWILTFLLLAACTPEQDDVPASGRTDLTPPVTWTVRP